jgi:ribose-phosphate pyrophosphokinase
MRFFITPPADHLRPRLEALGARIGDWEAFRFADGERGYRLSEEVAGESVAVVGSVLPDPASLFDLIALERLLVENGGRHPALIIPYLGYARQDRPARSGEGSLGVVVAGLLRDLGAERIVALDVHSSAVFAALGAHAVEASAIALFAHHLASGIPIDTVVAPDRGARRRAERLAVLLRPPASVAVIEKVRPRPNVAKAMRLEGDVGGRRVLIIDDMIDTGETLCEAVRLLVTSGAISIRVAATHGIFSHDARERILHLPVDQLIVTNSLPQPQHARIEVLDIAPVLMEALSSSAQVPIR